MIPFFGIAFLNHISLGYGLDKIMIHLTFIGGAGRVSSLFVRICYNWTELLMTFVIYIVLNFCIGYFLAPSIITFFLLSGIFLLFNGVFATFFLLKVQRSNKPFAERMLTNNREDIHFWKIDAIKFLLFTNTVKGGVTC